MQFTEARNPNLISQYFGCSVVEGAVDDVQEFLDIVLCDHESPRDQIFADAYDNGKQQQQHQPLAASATAEANRKRQHQLSAPAAAAATAQQTASCACMLSTAPHKDYAVR